MCDPNLPMITDASGAMNNILEIAQDISEASSIKKSAYGVL